MESLEKGVSGMQEVGAEANDTSASGEKENDASVAGVVEAAGAKMNETNANDATKTALACVVKFGFLAKPKSTNDKNKEMAESASDETQGAAKPESSDCKNQEAIKNIFGGDNNFTLSIPYYQRPYVWGEKEVNILLKDIESQLEDKKDKGETSESYLLGSLILCEKTESKNGSQDSSEQKAESKNGGKTLEIVDGQQRLTTLALILHALDKALNNTPKAVFLKDSKFEHNDSKINIKQNFKIIEKYFKTHKDKIQDFKNFLTNNIEFVCVLAPSLDDAFIFFDSANAKGKKLESYDLIKAFHLRALQKDDDIKRKAEFFEKLAKKDEGKYIHTLLSEILTPARVWLKDSEASKTALEINAYNEFCQEYFGDEHTNLKHSAINLGILQSFAGGKDFFKYLQKFNYFYKQIEKQLEKLGKNRYELLLRYNDGGLAYAQYVFFMAIMIFYDKFYRTKKDKGCKDKKSEVFYKYFMLLIMRANFNILIDQDSIEKQTARHIYASTALKHAKKLLPKLYFTSFDKEMERNLKNFIILPKEKESNIKYTAYGKELIKSFNSDKRVKILGIPEFPKAKTNYKETK